MKDRQKRMLRFMLSNKDILLIDDLAETFSVGRRTVSRDLDVLDKWLSLRGSRLERKQNHGIQVLTFGNDPEELLEIINKPDSFLETLSPSVRQKLTLLYLLFNNREVKISEIAHTFFISDTSVWNDLNHIEENLPFPSLRLERQKGIGIRLYGDESEIRLAFLSVLTELFSSKTIIPYLYSLKEHSNASLEINQFKLLMKRLKFPDSSESLQKLIAGVCGKLGYQFTMSGDALLYFYLQLTIHRVKSGALIEEKTDHQCQETFFDLGESVLTSLLDRIFSGKLPRGEIKLLGLILQVQEIGDLSTVDITVSDELIGDDIHKLTEEMINDFSSLDNRLYYLNDRMESVINHTLASLVLRLKYRIPMWHGEWGNSSSENWGRREKEDILSRLLLKYYNLPSKSSDFESLLLHFHSLVISARDIPEHKVRCLVSCFEGIGLASYLQSVLQREIEEINIVEATAVFKIHQEYIDEKGIELVLSTFPIGDLSIPVIPIALPINKATLKRDISMAVGEIKNISKSVDKESGTKGIETPESISFHEILSFIQNFEMYNFPEASSSEQIISLLSDQLTGNRKDSEKLSISFQKREDLGPLYFEEYGLRVLHCKSSVLEEPRAGVISFDDTLKTRMIFMTAPDPCPDEIRKMLSAITISFLENRQFRRSIISGDLKEIRKNLMDIYKELL